MENYTLVLSEHSGILHTCALMAQHCTQNHWYLAGLLMMRPYLVRTGVAVDTEDCAGTGVDVCRLRRWKWSVPWRRRWWWWSACHWCPGLPSQVYTGLLVRRRSWVRLLSHRVVWREDCSYFWWRRSSGLHADGGICFRCRRFRRRWPLGVCTKNERGAHFLTTSPGNFHPFFPSVLMRTGSPGLSSGRGCTPWRRS